MYKDYFAFSEQPFSIVPDARYLYMSGRHREALAHLLYGVEADGGFVLLTGDIGTGKTTVCRCLLENLPANCDVAFIYNPKLTVEELLATICEEFGIKSHFVEGGTKHLIDAINAFLLEQHARQRKALLIIDEAQNLSVHVLEQLRLLTNLETNQRKLLQIILLGQPELEDMLASNALRQLAQRIVARYHLGPLSRQEVTAYVSHRLTVAGSGRKLFSPYSLWRIYQLSKGVPRVINLLCDRALLGAYVQGKNYVNGRTVNKAAGEVLGRKNRRISLRRIFAWSVAGAAALGGTAVLAIAYYHQVNQSAFVAGTVPPKIAAVSATTIDVVPTVDETLKWPEGLAKSESQSQSMTVLFGLWKLNYRVNGGQPLCLQAAKQGLSCLSGRGKLEDLRSLDLPAILQLSDSQGEVFHAALTALDEKTAMVVIGDGMLKEISLPVLTRRWQGAYTVLWRAPPNYDKPLRIGAKGEPVAWLRRQLAKVNGSNAKVSDRTSFDEGLYGQVKEFQMAEGLPSTGIAGPLTLVHLASRNDMNAPKLVTPKSGGERMSTTKPD
ncbi:MAG: AAA family ATPase [Pseudomonadota bacterium]